MIGQLRGRLAEKRPNQVLVDVGGVGYVVQVPLSTYAALGELHTEVTLLIHTHVREDALALYGFVSSREKHFFEMPLSFFFQAEDGIRDGHVTGVQTCALPI